MSRAGEEGRLHSNRESQRERGRREQRRSRKVNVNDRIISNLIFKLPGDGCPS